MDDRHIRDQEIANHKYKLEQDLELQFKEQLN